MRYPRKPDLRLPLVLHIYVDLNKEQQTITYNVSLYQRRYIGHANDDGLPLKTSVFYRFSEITSCFRQHFDTVNFIEDYEIDRELEWSIEYRYDTMNHIKFENMRNRTYENVRRCVIDKLREIGWVEKSSKGHSTLPFQWMGETIKLENNLIFEENLNRKLIDLIELIS
jgi:hypothetical protein